MTAPATVETANRAEKKAPQSTTASGFAERIGLSGTGLCTSRLYQNHPAQDQG